MMAEAEIYDNSINDRIARIVKENSMRPPLDYLRGLAYNIRYWDA